MSVHDFRLAKAAANPPLPSLDDLIARGDPRELAAALRIAASFSDATAQWPEDAWGVPIGLSEADGLMTADQESHRIIVGDSGRGKGTSLIVPMGLHRQLGRNGKPVSMVFVDVKDGEAAQLTRGARMNMGLKTYVLDPMGVTQGVSETCNPLDLIDPFHDNFASRCSRLSKALIGNEEKADRDPYFRNGAIRLQAAGIGLACLTPELGKDLLRVRQQFMSGAAGLEYLAEQMCELDGAPAFIRLAGNDLKRLLTIAPKELSGNLGYITDSTAFLDEPRIARTMIDNSFSWKAAREEGATIYIVAPDLEVREMAPWIRLMLETMRSENDLSNFPSKAFGHDIHVLIDEAAALGPWSWLEDGLRAFRSNRILMHLVYQNVGQLKRLWGEGWTQMTAVELIQFLGTNCEATCKWIAELIGETVIVDQSISETQSATQQTSQNRTNSTGESDGETTGTTASKSHARSVGKSVNRSESVAKGQSIAETTGRSTAVTEGESVSTAVTHGSGSSVQSSGQGVSSGSSSNSSTTTTTTQSRSVTETESSSETETESETHTVTQGSGETETETETHSEAQQHGTSRTRTRSTATAQGSGESAQQGVSHSLTARRRLLTVAEVRSLAEEFVMTFYRGSGGLPISKLNYFAHPVLLARIFEGLVRLSDETA
jgi:type IV secretory pathway TraG/TraD family ATPase VirD4